MSWMLGETHRERVCAVIAAAAGLLFVLPFLFLLLDRAPPYERQSGRIVPENPKAGDTVAVHWTGERVRSCFGTVNRIIIDSSGVIHAFEAVDAVYADATQGKLLVREFTLPTQLPEGPAIYRATSLYVCNPVQRLWPIHFRGPDVKFNVAR